MKMLAFAGVLVCLSLTASPALASSREVDAWFLSLSACFAGGDHVAVPPSPGSGTNDGGFPRICVITMGGTPGTPRPVWQASTGEWVLVFASAGQFSTQALCEQAASATFGAGQLDGRPREFEETCLRSPSGRWFVTFRLLMHPLPAGEHTVTLQVSLPSGFVLSRTQTVTVVPAGY